MDLREELLNKSLMMLHEAGISDLDVIKTILVRAIGDYEISERCTDIAVIDDNNIQIIKYFLASKKIEGGSEKTAETRFYVLKKFDEFNSVCKVIERKILLILIIISSVFICYALCIAAGRADKHMEKSFQKDRGIKKE